MWKPMKNKKANEVKINKKGGMNKLNGNEI